MLACPAASLAQQAAPTALGEVVVTATRQEQALSRVPQSVAVLSNEAMTELNIKTVTDVVQWTPGVTFRSLGDAGGGSVAIRGVASSVGPATTGVYVGDVPIHLRQVAYYASAVYPEVFDLERVEVLRGPQGTLFGASSMGGALRYIPREGSLRNYSVYARGELSTVQHGGRGGEAGVAVGGPIIQDVLGFRASAYFRRDPGFIDLISVPSATVVDRSGSRGPIEGAGGSIVATAPISTYDKDANRSDVWAFQGSLNFQPTDNVRVKPSVLYQERDANYAGDSIDLPFSDSSSGKFNAMWFSGAAPTAQNGYLQLVRPDGKGGKDKLAIVTLPIEVDVGPVTLYSTTGYVYNKRDYTLDFTLGNMTVYGSLPWVPAGGRVSNWNIDTQKSFTQEFRASIGSKEDRFSGAVGLFYNFQRQFERTSTPSGTTSPSCSRSSSSRRPPPRSARSTPTGRTSGARR